MKMLIPQNDVVLCTQQSNAEKKTESGFVYESNDIPLYLVVDIGPNVKMPLLKSDIVVVNSTGTKVVVDGSVFFLFKEENIMGKICED